MNPLKNNLVKKTIEIGETLRLALEAAPNAMIIVNKEGKIILINTNAEHLFGYRTDELLGQLIEILVPEKFRSKHPDYRNSFFNNPKTRALGVGNDLFGLKKDGSEVSIEIGLNPIQTSEGIFALASIIDITERKRVEEDLKRSNEELQNFAYVASHDLQEPLRMISNYAQLLEKYYNDKLDKNGKEFIGYLVGGVKNMKRLIDDLLEYSRVGSKEKIFAEVDCNQVMSEVLKSITSKVSQTNSKVIYDKLPIVSGDRIQLTQLFQNLILNAIKFQSKSIPEIHISSSPRKNEWLFSVRDNGIGITREHQERIFEIFQRLHTKDEYEGTGIGLSICKKIVERHQGKIWVESEEGKGSIFYFTISQSVFSREMA